MLVGGSHDTVNDVGPGATDVIVGIVGKLGVMVKVLESEPLKYVTFAAPVATTTHVPLDVKVITAEVGFTEQSAVDVVVFTEYVTWVFASEVARTDGTKLPAPNEAVREAGAQVIV